MSEKLHIEYNPDFRRHFGMIWDFIANDSVSRANGFKDQLRQLIETLEDSPYRYRQSHYYDKENIRDLIFKGYTIPYLVDKKKDLIIVLDIYKWVDR